MRSKAPSRPREHRPAAARRAAARQAVWDRRLWLAIAAAVVAALVYVRAVVYPSGAMYWSYQVVMLCLVVVAAAGRALVGQEAGAQGAGDRWPRLERVAIPLIAAAAILPYLPSLTVGFLSDDFGLTSSIASAGGPSHLLSTRPFPSLWRPLHALAWWAQFSLWGRTATGYHAVAVLFHAANAVLVYALGRRIMGAFPGALLAGLLFAVQPVHASTVAWVSCQPDLQCALFALLSLVCLEAYLAPARRGRRWLAFAGALLAFFLALLTKEAALALPGVAVLRAGTIEGGRRWRRVVGVGAAYGALLPLYFALRLIALGRFGGYRLSTSFWNTVFPSAPLRQMIEFFFPINQGWLSAAAPWLLWPLLIVMAIFLFWCIGQLTHLPARRLLLYAGFLVLMAVPAWLYPSFALDMEYVRFGYLPTIGLVWLVAEILAAGTARRRSYALAGMAAAAALCCWWVMPWRAAGETVREVVRAGKQMVAEAPPSAFQQVFFVEDLPDQRYGALIFRNGFGQALAEAMGKPVLVEVVGRRGDIPPEAMSLSTLLPGEYLFAWDGKTKQMRLRRAGAAEAAS